MTDFSSRNSIPMGKLHGVILQRGSKIYLVGYLPMPPNIWSKKLKGYDQQRLYAYLAKATSNSSNLRKIQNI